MSTKAKLSQPGYVLGGETGAPNGLDISPLHITNSTFTHPCPDTGTPRDEWVAMATHMHNLRQSKEQGRGSNTQDRHVHVHRQSLHGIQIHKAPHTRTHAYPTHTIFRLQNRKACLLCFIVVETNKQPLNNVYE